MEKKWGKLTDDQFRRLIGALPEVRQQTTQIGEALRSASKEKIVEVLGGGIW